MVEHFVVVWGRDKDTQRLIPVDEDYYKPTAEEAKEAARALLPKVREPRLMPQEVLRISDDDFKAMLEGTTPLLTFNQDNEDLEVEMLQLRP